MSTEKTPEKKSARPAQQSRNAGGKKPSAARSSQQARRARLARKRRKMMIRRIAFVLALILLIVLILVIHSCAGKNKTDSVSEETEAKETARTEQTQEDAAEAPEEESASEAAEPQITVTPTPSVPQDLPQIDVNSWEFILANPWNSIDAYLPSVANIEGIQLDARIIPAMQNFVADTRAQGLSVVLASGYRDYDTQSWLFQRKVAQYGDEDVAATIVARPGTSEHQTGLAADITDQVYEYKNESLENTAMYQWMSQHCHEYGFIVRFPKGREDVTGIIYEPWHFRYVGVEAATYIMEHDITLEEFLSYYKDIEGPVASAGADAQEENTAENTQETEGSNAEQSSTVNDMGGVSTLVP